MRRTTWIVVAAGAAMVAGLVAGIGSGRLPLGVPGEWEWQRVRHAPSSGGWALGIAAVLAYSAFVALGSRALRGPAPRRRELAWLSGLVVAAIGAQAMVQEAAPEGYGLAKWIMALRFPGSSGYFSVARRQMADPRRFLADYPDWIAHQDALHVGTHPPGLFLAARALIDATEASPSLARAVIEWSPGSVLRTFLLFRQAEGLTRADAAALALAGALTLLACSSTVVPIYLLARSSGLSAGGAWASAALWPMVPSALMFQPTADTAFPLLSTSAMALAAGARRASGPRGVALALLSGVALAVGMEFSLAFLPVGLVVGVILASPPGPGLGRRLGLVGATGAGFLGATLAWWASTSANPFVIWWWNQRNHARFYEEFHRSYRAWVLANPVELAVGLGLPAATWAVVGLGSPRGAPRVAWATLFVLAFLTLGGRNLSEVGRLWLPMMPPLLVLAGSAFDRLGAGPRAVAASTALSGLQALALQATIQVVYPI